MKRNMENQQEFRELADWVINATLQKGAKECRIKISRQRFVEINYRDRKPEVIKEATTRNISLEVFADNRYAAKSTPDFRKSTLDSFISDTIDNARIMEEDPYRTLPDPKYYAGMTTADLELADPDQTSLSPEDRHMMAKGVEDACLEKGGDRVISVEAGEYDETYEEYVKTSNGFAASNASTSTWIGASMTARDEGDRRPAGYNWVGCRFRGDLPSLQSVGQIAAKRTLDLLGSKKIETETIPVIVENRAVINLLYGIIGPLSARSIQQKTSFLADKKGEQFASKLLTIIDNPLIPRGLGSKYYDGDCFPTRKRVLISDGVVNEFLVDWYYGRKLDWEPNSGSLSNIIIPPGSRNVEDIIKDLGRCILITDFIGGNSNSTTGDFSIGVMGRLYNKGQLAQNIAEMNIADNHLKFWNKLVEIGNDPWAYSQAIFPSLVFSDIVVSGV